MGLTQEIFFQRGHAGIDQQKALVILRHQRARLTRQDIAENLDRFLQVVSGQFPEEKKQRVEALRQALPD